jgi:hypothetical protein
VSSVNSPRKYHFQERGWLFKLKAGGGKGRITEKQQRGSCDSRSKISRGNPPGALFCIFLDLIWAPRAPRPRVKLQGWHLSARHQTDRSSRGTNRNDDDDSPKVIDGNYSRAAFRAEEIQKKIRNKAAVSRSNKRGAAFAASFSLSLSLVLLFLHGQSLSERGKARRSFILCEAMIQDNFALNC